MKRLATEMVCRVDQDLPIEVPGVILDELRERARGQGEEHRLRAVEGFPDRLCALLLRRVPKSVHHVVARGLPPATDRAADVSRPDHPDLHAAEYARLSI